MVDYVSLRATADRLITENGRDLTLIKAGTTAADPTEPWRTDTTAGETRIIVKGVFVEFENEQVDGSLIMRGDKMGLVAAEDVEDTTSSSESDEVETFDRLLDGTVDWKIVNVEAIEPGPSNVYYEIQVRK
jgi:hypothetical protein